MIQMTIGQINNFPEEEMLRFQNLLTVYTAHSAKNDVKERYYEGKISLDEVNLGIALPDGLRRLEIGCAWGAKTVDVLAGRSMFDGFVGVNGEAVDELDQITADTNHLGYTTENLAII